MSTVVDDPVVDPPEISDEEILTRCREIEVRRRADLAEHITLLRELEKRKLYYSDGHRDLAGYGRAEFRWADRDAKAHRDLERLCRRDPLTAVATRCHRGQAQCEAGADDRSHRHAVSTYRRSISARATDHRPTLPHRPVASGAADRIIVDPLSRPCDTHLA